VELTLTELGRAREIFCIGWAPLHLADFTETAHHVHLIKGPAVPPNNRPCFAFSMKAYTRFLKDQKAVLLKQFVARELEREKLFDPPPESDEDEDVPARQQKQQSKLDLEKEIKKLFVMPDCEFEIEVDLHFNFNQETHVRP
jgi:hypothetical protein